jgi:dimethylargininase
VGRNTILTNRAWLDTAQFPDLAVIDVPASEPWAGNSLSIGEVVILPGSSPETRHKLEAGGFCVQSVDVGELQKAEAGVTCCSLIFSE